MTIAFLRMFVMGRELARHNFAAGSATYQGTVKIGSVLIGTGMAMSLPLDTLLGKRRKPLLMSGRLMGMSTFQTRRKSGRSTA